MRRSATEIATAISRALLTARNPSWTPSLEQTLHQHLHKHHSPITPTLVSHVIDPHLLHHHSLALGLFNWASQQPNFSHTPQSYHALLKSLSLSRHFTPIPTILKCARAQQITLHPSIHRSIVASLLRAKKAHLAFSVFREVGPVMGPEICNSLLAALASGGSFTSARKVFDEMLESGVFTTLGFGVFVWRTCGVLGFDGVLRLVDEVRGRGGFSGVDGSVIAVLVVSGLCGEGRGDDAVRALEELRVRECKPDFMAYRVVVEMLRGMGRVADVEVVLKRKRKLGVAPRGGVYREVILRMVSEGLVREAMELGEVIVSGDFPMEDDVLNVLVGSVSGIDPSRAVSFLKFMLKKERLPTQITLINLSKNLCKHERTDQLVEVFELLKAKEYFSSLESYNLMVSFLCKAGRVREGYQVLQEMKKRGISPDILSYNYLLEACCREDLVRPAKRLWDEMFASGCYGNLESYNILIKKFSEVGWVEDACHLFYHMRDKGLEPNGLTYKCILQGLCQAKNLEMALQIFDKSVEQDVTLANNLLSPFLLGLCKEGFLHPASELLRRLTGDTGKLECHLVLLKYLAEIGELALATEHIQWVANKSHLLLHAIRTELSASLSSSLKPDPVVQLLGEMVKVS